MKRIFAITISLLLIISSGMTSCKNREKEKDQEKIKIDAPGGLESEIEKAVYPLPTSAEVIKMLTELEVGYIIGVSNSVDNASNYITSKSQA
ncbi:MAG TPA: hypothetical protein VJ877_04605, partial [Bacteroidales bacterium]|nr:hypothetical protein [Bacteroidales bacterium]